jgi:hypothetical protein
MLDRFTNKKISLPDQPNLKCASIFVQMKINYFRSSAIQSNCLSGQIVVIFSKRWNITGFFFIYFCIFLAQHNYTENLLARENRTRIARAEIHNADHKTTTTAQIK